jgi:hypothetical protein
MQKTTFFSAILFSCLLVSVSAQAKDYVLTLKNNKFVPQELTIPAKQKVKITVKNEDATPAEFESFDLNREKIIAPHGQVVVVVGPLDAGTYTFFDEFHKDTATGTLIVK